MNSNTKMRLLKEAHNMVWSMTRHIYPITSVITEVDFSLYKKFNVYEQYREITDLHEKLQESIMCMVKEIAKEHPDD